MNTKSLCLSPVLFALSICTSLFTLSAHSVQASEGVRAGFDDHTEINKTYYTGQTQAGQQIHVEQFPGVPVQGWASPWEINTTGSSRRDKRVMDEKPLMRGHGNYLQFEIQDTAGMPTNRQAYVTRAFEGHGTFDPSKPYTVEFLYRADNTEAFKGGGATYIEIYDGSGWELPPRTWMIRSLGNVKKYWAVWDGNLDGKFDYRQLLNSKMPIVEGRVYRIQVKVYPDSRKWDVAIQDQTSKAVFSASDLGLLNDQPSYSRLLFGAQVSSPQPKTVPTIYTFSIDSISLVAMNP